MPIAIWLNAFITRNVPGYRLAAFCLGMTVVPAAAADRDLRAAPTAEVARQPAASADVTEVVAPNCLLPGQIRSFGGITIVTPRRPVMLAAADCAARGGEPIAGAAASDQELRMFASRVVRWAILNAVRGLRPLRTRLVPDRLRLLRFGSR